jgi:hypothetical protein
MKYLHITFLTFLSIAALIIHSTLCNDAIDSLIKKAEQSTKVIITQSQQTADMVNSAHERYIKAYNGAKKARDRLVKAQEQLKELKGEFERYHLL